MGRAIVAILVLAFVGLVGWLAGSGGSTGAPARAPAARPDFMSEYRISELERRVGRLESRPGHASRSDRSVPAVTNAEVVAESGSAPRILAPAAEAPPQDSGTAQVREDLKLGWMDRYGRQQTAERRLDVLREAGVGIGGRDDAAARRKFFEEVQASAVVGSDEWAHAGFGLGYVARNDKDFAASDAHFLGVQRAVAADSASYAMAEFQLGWNRKFDGDGAASEVHFRRLIEHPAAEPGTKAAARFAIANTKREQGDPAGARTELEALLEESKAHPADGSTLYYVGLAKGVLTAGNG